MASLLSDVDVTLIIKAPNQKISDQTVKCEMEWTVKRLKQHLSEVYPNKPKENQQRIIYSGRLLHDHLTLKEILKKENQTHTVHLVCPPEKSSELPKATNANSRVNLSSTYSEEELRRLHQEYYNYIYHFYHQQYLRNYLVSAPALSTSPATAQSSSFVAPSVDQTVVNQGPTEPQVRQPPPAAVQPAAMAAGPGGIGDEFDEENFERDWLDWFYYALRVAILIGLLNYYSSLSKILTTLGISCVFCLYRLIFQRRNRVERQQPPQRPVPPPAEEAAAPEGVPSNPESAASVNSQDRSDASANENVRSNASTTPTNAEEIRPEQISMVRKLWNSFYLCTQFFVTLFTSLVPERIQPLDLN